MTPIDKEKYPLVTIVTPSFNQGKFIERTIKSVLDQGYPNLEYLVFDGGSTDNTLDVLEKYKDKLTYVSEKDNGQTDAINKGFKAATGEIIGWLNSDDTYEPEAINTAVEHFQNNPDLMMLYGKGAHIYENGDFMEWYPNEPHDFQRLSQTCYICQPAVFLRPQIFKEVGYLDEKLDFCMDYEYWIRIAKKNSLEYLPIHLANTRLYDDTKTLSKRVEAHEEIIRVVKKHYNQTPDYWIYVYCQHVLNRHIKRTNKFKNYLYVSLLALLVPINNLRFNHKIFSGGVKEFLLKGFNQLKSLIRI